MSRCKPWTTTDINYLKANDGAPVEDVARALRRTVKAVYHQAGLHGIHLQPVRRRRLNTYTRHTDSCGGIDHILIDRIISAGTVEAVQGQPVCDCERAYIIKYVPNASDILKVNTETARRLAHIEV